MKYPVLVFFLLVGLVVSVSAANINPELNGSWISYDGPCSPCQLNIASSGVTFTQAGDTVEVTDVVGTGGPGIHVFLENSGELNLELTKKSKRLVGFYTNYREIGNLGGPGIGEQTPVLFDRKK